MVECLLEQGVDTIFGYPGGAVLNIYDALYAYEGRIRHILTAHEQGAAHAADGYARSTGKTGVVLATSGPGATNLVTGIANAYMDSVPMVAITGNVATSLLGLDSFQEVDITGITMPITKHNYIVKDVQDLARTVREAFQIANEGRKGPVLIDIPKDVTANKAEYEPVPPVPPARVTRKIRPADVEHALELIRQSKRPFLYTGGGILSAGAEAQLKRFAELVDAPVASTLMGLGGYDGRDERFTGMLGMHGTKTSSLAVGECDLFIALGVRFSDRVICDAKTFARRSKVLHIDVDEAELGKNIPIDGKITGDIHEILSLLCEKLEPQQNAGWMAQIAAWKAAYPLAQTARYGVLPQQVLETLDALTPPDTIITTEVGQHQMWTAQFYRFAQPRTLVTSGGLGTMGFGLGAAIGSAVGNPQARVINIAGDGSFHMNMAELSTAAKYRIPIIEMVFNNSVLGMVRQWQTMFYNGHYSHTNLENPTDYELLAKALGLEAFTIREEQDIEPVLRAALAAGGPVLVNCIIDKDLPVLPMVPAGGSVEEPILEL